MFGVSFSSACVRSHGIACVLAALAAGCASSSSAKSNGPENSNRTEGEKTMVNVALLVPMQAKSGKEKDVTEFLNGGLPIVQEERETAAWFPIRSGSSSFGIFDAFP